MTTTETATTVTDDVGFQFDNTYAEQLDGFYAAWQAEEVPAPRLVAFNRDLAELLRLDSAALDSDLGAKVFSGNVAPAGAQPLAQAYAGHQFGGFVPQLGDGRALLLGEVVGTDGRRYDVQLKGSGRTPFSRGGDGKAAIGPVLREYLLSEAMFALGVPTTRALAAVTTGEHVARERPLPGAVLTRVAGSHLRIGTFQYFAARGDQGKVRQLADYAIARHDPDLVGAPDQYLELLRAVCARQAELVARWMLLGFVHGVMNTDNTTISGETIDYGPCAFMERYDPATSFSSIDHGKRYAYGNQPAIAQWNLARLAETLLSLIDDDEERGIERATEALGVFGVRFQEAWQRGVSAKLGLSTEADSDGDGDLAHEFLQIARDEAIDWTLGFRRLASLTTSSDLAQLDPGRRAEAQAVSSALDRDLPALERVESWLERWRGRLRLESRSQAEIEQVMCRVNPLVIPRNQHVEAALESATDEGDLAPFECLLEAVTMPFEYRSEVEGLLAPSRADMAPYRTFCGT